MANTRRKCYSVPRNGRRPKARARNHRRNPSSPASENNGRPVRQSLKPSNRSDGRVRRPVGRADHEEGRCCLLFQIRDLVHPLTSDTIPVMTNLTSVVNQLEQERTRLASQLERLNNAITALNGTGNNRTGRTLSAAGRARIAAAQRARWAKAKGKKVVSITARKRTMSPANRKKIAAAQRARWAKWRKEQKG